MTLDSILATIDAEIASLQQARALLAGIGTGARGGKPAAPSAPNVARAHISTTFA